MHEQPLLYSFRRCPYAMRARLSIIASGSNVILREIILRNKPEPMLVASPKGTVPVLILPDSQVIDESLDIMTWALNQDDPMQLLSHRDDALIAHNDGPFKQALDHFKYPTRYDLTDIEAPRGEGLKHLQNIDVMLDGQKYLAGGAPGFTDFATFPFIRQFSMVDKDWYATQQLPRLKPWLKSLLESKWFETAMVKHSPWQDGDPVTIFP